MENRRQLTHEEAEAEVSASAGCAAAAGSAIPLVLDPDYSAFVVKARIAARDCGYALALHGSMMRDLDLIAIPWIKECRTPTALIAQVKYRTECETNGHPVHEKEHGRLTVVFMIGKHFSDARYVDFSIMPPSSQNSQLSSPETQVSE